jgi:hypothetical protein
MSTSESTLANPTRSNGSRWYRRGWIIGSIALIAGFGLGAVIARSNAKSTTVTLPPQTVALTVDGHIPVLTDTVHPTKLEHVAGPTKTVTRTVRGQAKTVTVPPPRVAGLTRSPIADGTWQVGVDVAPGTYHATGGSGCRWSIAWVSVKSGHNRILSRGEIGQTDPKVALSDGDSFTTSNCGTWH